MNEDSFPTKVKKRNIAKAFLYDQNEWKGAYALKVIDPRKEQYKRVKMRVTELDEEDE